MVRTDENVYLENHVNRNINNYLNLYCCCCCDGIDISINRWKTTAILLVVLIVEKYTVSRVSLRFVSSLVCSSSLAFSLKWRDSSSLSVSQWQPNADDFHMLKTTVQILFFFHHWNKLFLHSYQWCWKNGYSWYYDYIAMILCIQAIHD